MSSNTETGKVSNFLSTDKDVTLNGIENEHLLETNGTLSNTVISTMKVENPECDEKCEVEDSDVPDEEENLFLTLEEQKEKEQKEITIHPHVQPKAVEAAPRLLQAAIKDGQVRASDSEEDSDKEKLASSEATKDEQPHYHKRDSHLDFLLNKASEYSNFISQDLDDLQAAMADNARKALAKADKKRRIEKSERMGNKKQKSGCESFTNIETVQPKDSATRKISKPIFVQPPNLAEGCYLKDYQLEGVRWLASLFENGVSGILADGA